MADLTFNTVSGQTIERELLIAYLNTGTSAVPVWSPVGKRVTDSSEQIDWSSETNTDIMGNSYTELKKPVITQTFDPVPLDGGDSAIVKMWNMGIKDQDRSALAAQDMLIVHLYAGTANSAMFAERYTSCAVVPSSLGGEGGGTLGMPLEVTYGGERITGTAAKSSSTGTITFTPDSDSSSSNDD